MVAQLLRLKADMLLGVIRSDSARVAARIASLLLTLFAAVLVAVGIGAAPDDSASSRSAVVIVGTLILLGATIIPFVVGARDGFDPLRFRHLPITQRDAAVGLVVAGALGWPLLCIAVVLVGAIGAWSVSAGSAIAGVVAAVLIIIQAGLLVRLAVALGARVTRTEWTRGAQWLIALVVVILLAIGLPVLAVASAPAGAVPNGFARALGWTPWGAPWAFPAAAMAGNGWLATAHLVESLAAIALLAWAWWRVVGTALEATPPSRPETSLLVGGWFRVLGGSAAGVIAARSMTYWGRDPRYRASYLILVVVPIVVVPLGVAGVPWGVTALVPLPLMALIAGFLPHNDVAYDGTALWMHIASGVRGWADRLGRVAPILIVGVPAVVVGAIIATRLAQVPEALAAELGASLCLLLAGLGVASLASALLPYPAVRPGDRPFQQPQSLGTQSVSAQVLTLAVTLLLASPTITLGVLAIVQRDAALGARSVVVGIATGVVMLAIGVVGGGALFDRRGPLLLQAVQRF